MMLWSGSAAFVPLSLDGDFLPGVFLAPASSLAYCLNCIQVKRPHVCIIVSKVSPTPGLFWQKERWMWPGQDIWGDVSWLPLCHWCALNLHPGVTLKELWLGSNPQERLSLALGWGSPPRVSLSSSGKWGQCGLSLLHWPLPVPFFIGCPARSCGALLPPHKVGGCSLPLLQMRMWDLDRPGSHSCQVVSQHRTCVWLSPRLHCPVTVAHFVMIFSDRKHFGDGACICTSFVVPIVSGTALGHSVKTARGRNSCQCCPLVSSASGTMLAPGSGWCPMSEGMEGT